ETAASDVDGYVSTTGWPCRRGGAVEHDDAREPAIGLRGETVGQGSTVAEAGDEERSLVGSAHEAGRPPDVGEKHVGRPAPEHGEVGRLRLGRQGVGTIVDSPRTQPGRRQIEPEVLAWVLERQLAVHVHPG